MIHFIKYFSELLIVRLQAVYTVVAGFELIAKISIFRPQFNT